MKRRKGCVFALAAIFILLSIPAAVFANGGGESGGEEAEPLGMHAGIRGKANN